MTNRENYFDHQKIHAVANRVNAEAVIVPIYVGGAQNTESYFKLVDCWVNGLLKAAQNKDIIQ